MKRVLLVISVAGCAQGGRGTSDASERIDSQLPIDSAAHDAPLSIDGPIQIDAPVAIDAPVVIDAPVMIDAPVVMIDAPMVDAPCVPVVTQLLANATFDSSPAGTGWATHPVDIDYPLITAPTTGAAPAQSAPYYVWLGGYEGYGDDATDWVYQDVTIPANTTQLTLTGYYFVATGETTSSTVYDYSILSLLTTGNAAIEDVGGLTNLTTTTQWMPFQFTFTPNLSGQTVRLRMISVNDDSNGTAFWWDTFALNATHCP